MILIAVPIGYHRTKSSVWQISVLQESNVIRDQEWLYRTFTFHYIIRCTAFYKLLTHKLSWSHHISVLSARIQEKTTTKQNKTKPETKKKITPKKKQKTKQKNVQIAERLTIMILVIIIIVKVACQSTKTLALLRIILMIRYYVPINPYKMLFGRFGAADNLSVDLHTIHIITN